MYYLNITVNQNLIKNFLWPMFLTPIRNIVDFYNKVSQILDTQSKKTLWKFILLKLTPPHQEYCLNRINLSEEVLLGKQPFPHPHRKPI